MDAALDLTDNALLSQLLDGLPLEHRPFAALGRRLGISEQDYLDRVSRLRGTGHIARLAASVDGQRLGYRSSLVAMRLEPERLGDAARVLARHPGVASIERVDDPLNCWVRLAVPATDSLAQTVASLGESVDAARVAMLPLVRRYPTAADDRARRAADPDEDSEPEPRSDLTRPSLTKTQLSALRVLQADLPLLELPFVVLAAQAGITEEALLICARSLKHAGIIRRLAAVPAAKSLDVPTITIAWQLPDEQLDNAGRRLAQFRQVLRCVRRAHSAEWPYSLFTTVTAGPADSSKDLVNQAQEILGAMEHRPLCTIASLLQRPIIYCSDALDGWWQEQSAIADKISSN